MMVQSCAEASPAKWHLAHTAWFFESFVLREFLPGCRLYDPDFSWLFNSYYQSFTEFPEKKLRSSFSRPGLISIFSYREYVDQGILRLLERGAPAEALARIELGLNHEEQHQELLLTDIKHAFFTNPLQPAYLDGDDEEAVPDVQPMRYLSYPGGLVEIGQDEGNAFGFDNERPRHRTWLEPFQLGSRLVTCGEYLEFMEDKGYERPELWLSAGWDTVKAHGWKAPLYWQRDKHHWTVVSLRGKRKLEAVISTPVAHVSYFEADAYARWAGKRLPTEAEWESVAADVPVAGNLLDTEALEPREASAFGIEQNRPSQLFGDCWEWTASAYLGYPGFVPLGGTLGEYNGKFMSGQMVLRGGSCVTPQRHIRASYRNFFSPETRWQFSGIRLASS
jgi:ergothioneine biosynthesis protein EgtB